MKNEQLLRIAERLLPYTADFPEPVRELFGEFIMTGEVPVYNMGPSVFYIYRMLLRAAGHGDERRSDMDDHLPTRYFIGVGLLFSFEDSPGQPDVALEMEMDKLERMDPR